MKMNYKPKGPLSLPNPSLKKKKNISKFCIVAASKMSSQEKQRFFTLDPSRVDA